MISNWILCCAAEAISGGKVMIYVSYFGVHVHSETIDLCKETSCPISAGDFVLSHKQTLPSFTPPVSPLALYFPCKCEREFSTLLFDIANLFLELVGLIYSQDENGEQQQSVAHLYYFWVQNRLWSICC